MSDTVFFILDALLNAAKGMVTSSRAKAVQQEHKLEDDPRSKLSRVFTSPAGYALTGLLGSYFINKDMTTNAKNQTYQRRYF